MNRSLLRRAIKHFPRHLPHHDYNRRNWLRAVHYLRTESRGGWILDGRVERKA